MESNLKDSLPVVQGQSVGASVYGHSAGYPDIQSRGQHQPKRCNDVFWAILFYLQIAGMICCAAIFLPQLELDFEQAQDGYNGYYNDDKNGEENNNAYYGDDNQNAADDGYYYNRKMMEIINSGNVMHSLMKVATRSLVHVAKITGMVSDPSDERMLQEENPNALFLLIGLTTVGAFFISITSLGFMIKYAEGLIKASFFFNMALGLVASVAGFASGSTEAGIMGLVFFLMGACYAWMVWSRIPFAAINLVTASSAIKANIGVTFFAYGAIVMNGLWLVLWSAATYSTLFVLGDCDAEGNCNNEISGLYVFLFVLSLYWTAQVIKNVLHTTVAGTVGTWWWTPIEAQGCCSKAVRDSHNRAMTSSFGSICLGSLLVAIIQTLKSFMESARESDDGALKCIADCLLGCLEQLMELFNEWAFVYVGLYGYSFVDAAKNVVTLFKQRGWTAIITDYIVDRVLVMISIGNGIIAGGVAALLSYSLTLNLAGVAFGVGFVVGVILSMVVLGVVSSGVNTIIVCYAEDPASFEINHYELSVRMRETWRSAHPQEFKY